MPHFKSKTENYINYIPKSIRSIESIPKEKLQIIDNSSTEISGTITSIYQDYKGDIIYVLEKAKEKLKKHNKLTLVYPTKLIYPFPTGILVGFKQFCRQYHFDFNIIEAIDEQLKLETKQVYITVEDGHLVQLMQQIKKKT